MHVHSSIVSFSKQGVDVLILGSWIILFFFNIFLPVYFSSRLGQLDSMICPAETQEIVEGFSPAKPSKMFNVLETRDGII